MTTHINEVLTVDMDSGDFVQVHVWLDMRKEIRRFITIKPEGEAPVIMREKYEMIATSTPSVA
jgi:hypothetical protein